MRTEAEEVAKEETDAAAAADVAVKLMADG